MRIVAATLALSLTACSFFVTSAPKPPPDPPSCSDAYATPLLDVFGALVGGPMSAVFAWIAVHDEKRATRDNVIGATIGITMIAFTASAIVGFSRVSRCKDAQDAYTGEMMMRNARPQYAPPPYVPPEPPAGVERGVCRPDGTCDAGLTCASNRCVVLPAMH